MATKKITETESVETTNTDYERRVIQLLEAIDWKLWEFLKVAKPEMTDAE